MEKQKVPKLLLMGLARAGKTVITKFFLQSNPLLRRDDCFHATIDYEKHRLDFGDKIIDIFDTGGATAFLDRFTGELAKYIFSDVKTFVFVLDSIEIKDISRAKYYLDLSLKQLRQYSLTARVFIFQHKVDLVPKHMRREVRQTIEEYILSGVNQIISEKNINYYETTVFTYSIIQAIDAVMAWMLDGELHLYHQYLQQMEQ